MNLSLYWFIVFIITIVINDNEPKAFFWRKGEIIYYIQSGYVLLLLLITDVLFNISYFLFLVLLMLCVGFFFITSNTESILTKH